MTVTEVGVEAQIEQHVREHRDADACRNLWLAVLERAAKDMMFVRRVERRPHMGKDARMRLNRIYRNCPYRFLSGQWFEQVCDYLDVEPKTMRRRIQERVRAA